MYSTYPVARRTDVRISIKQCFDVWQRNIDHYIKQYFQVIVLMWPFRSLYFGHLCWNCYLLGMKVLVHRIPYQRIATGSMIWNLDMKLTEVEGINHLFELFE
eukprot:78676_1